jgi:RNA polymerase sigma-70 factor (ECF subfamily)
MHANPSAIMSFQALAQSAPSERTAAGLVERLQEGDLSAVGEAYDLHHEHVRRFARRLVGDEDAAEDLVHETFLTLPKAIKKFEGRSALRTFLISIAVNHSRHHVRSAARRRKALNRASEEPLAPGHSSGQDCPEHEVSRRQMAAVLTRCLDKLTHDHRSAFVLCEVEELSSREVAEVLDVPEGTVRTRLMHAKKKLRAMIEKEGLR